MLHRVSLTAGGLLAKPLIPINRPNVTAALLERFWHRYYKSTKGNFRHTKQKLVTPVTNMIFATPQSKHRGWP